MSGMRVSATRTSHPSLKPGPTPALSPLSPATVTVSLEARTLLQTPSPVSSAPSRVNAERWRVCRASYYSKHSALLSHTCSGRRLPVSTSDTATHPKAHVGAPDTHDPSSPACALSPSERAVASGSETCLIFTTTKAPLPPSLPALRPGLTRLSLCLAHHCVPFGLLFTKLPDLSLRKKKKRNQNISSLCRKPFQASRSSWE